jgi:hypothetical protein
MHEALRQAWPVQLHLPIVLRFRMQSFAAGEVIFREPPLVAAQHAANK